MSNFQVSELILLMMYLYIIQKVYSQTCMICYCNAGNSNNQFVLGVHGTNSRQKGTV